MSKIIKFKNSRWNKNHIIISKHDANYIVKTFCEFLKLNAPPPGFVSDSEKLPFSKVVIKNALVNMLSRTQNQIDIEKLKFIYIHMAIWQEGVGEQYKSFDIKENALNFNQRSDNNIMISKEENETEKIIWHGLVSEEYAKLKKELNRLGFIAQAPFLIEKPEKYSSVEVNIKLELPFIDISNETVLFVDNNREWIDSISMNLKKNGFSKFFIAEKYSEAISIIEKNGNEIILLATHNLGSEGYEGKHILDYLNRYFQINIGVLFITALPQIYDEIKICHNSNNVILIGCIEKPFMPEVLFDALRFGITLIKYCRVNV